DDPTYSSPESDVEDLSQMANSDQSENENIIEEIQELQYVQEKSKESIKNLNNTSQDFTTTNNASQKAFNIYDRFSGAFDISCHNKSRGATQTPTRKRKVDDLTRKEEAYTILQDLKNKRQRDKFDVFGEHVACKVRDLNNTCAQNVVEHLISNILFEASMGKYDRGLSIPTNTYGTVLSTQTDSSYCSTPVLSPPEPYMQNSSSLHPQDTSSPFHSSDIISQAFQLSNL
ncbi:hypothetical protein NQ314_021506, partial [Rhamnusium bicolor]